MMAVNIKENDLPLNVVWDDEDECYIVTCEKYESVIGTGDTKDEAVKVFYELLEDWLKPDKPRIEAKNKGGRPKKSNVRLSVNVLPLTKANISYLAIEKKVNQGLILDEIVNFYMENKK